MTTNANKENYILKKVYEAIAEILPVLGRDFDVSTSVSENNINIKVKGITNLGRLIESELTQKLKDKMLELIKGEQDGNK